MVKKYLYITIIAAILQLPLQSPVYACNIVKAIQNNELETVKEIIEKNKNITLELVGPNSETPIFLAYKEIKKSFNVFQKKEIKQAYKILEYLLEHATDSIKIPNEDNKTILWHTSIEEEDTEIVQKIVSKLDKETLEKIVCLQDTVEKESPLLLACKFNKTEIFKLLLPYCPTEKINDKDMFKRTPLYWAYKNDNPEIIELLLKQGALKTRKVIQNITANAIKRNELETIKEIIKNNKNITLEPVGESLETPILLAYYKKTSKIFEYLLEHAADSIEIPDEDLKTILWYASAREDIETIKKIVASIDDKEILKEMVCLRDTLGEESPISLACRNNRTDILKLLLPYLPKENTNDEAKNQTTLLYWAYKNYNEEMIELLLKHGATKTQKIIDTAFRNILLSMLPHQGLKPLASLCSEACKNECVHTLIDRLKTKLLVMSKQVLRTQNRDLFQKSLYLFQKALRENIVFKTLQRYIRIDHNIIHAKDKDEKSAIERIKSFNIALTCGVLYPLIAKTRLRAMISETKHREKPCLTEEDIPNLDVCCPACLEDINDADAVALYPCGHLIHTDCFKEYTIMSDKGHQCPVCRSNIEGIAYLKNIITKENEEK